MCYVALHVEFASNTGLYSSIVGEFIIKSANQEAGCSQILACQKATLDKFLLYQVYVHLQAFPWQY